MRARVRAQAKARTQVEVQAAQARARAEAQAEVWARAWTEERRVLWTEVWARAWAPAVVPAEVWTEVWERAQKQAQVREQRQRRRAEAEMNREEEWRDVDVMLALDSGWVEVAARAQAETQTAVRAQALVRAIARVQAGITEVAGKGSIVHRLAQVAKVAEILPPEAIVPHPYVPTYQEVLADSKIKDIVDSIKPYYRHRLTHHLWHHLEHWWLIQIIAPVTRLPPVLLQSILSMIINDSRNSPLVLMLVCKHWYTMVTGIWASFKLGTRTPRDAVTKKLERNQWLLDIVIDTEIDRGDLAPSEGAYEAIFAAIEATSRWRSLVVETFARPTDFPEQLVKRGLQRRSSATMNRLRSFKTKCACEMSPLLDRLLRILGTTASAELTTVEINSANVISFLLPAYSPIFRSVKVLVLDGSGMHGPVDLLPHLHQLETFTASHLSLPIYPDDTDLPFVNTLRRLTLRAVSVQWMSGRTFDILESSTISFPLHHHLHILPVFSTTLPNCKHLTFQGHPINILDGVSASKLIHLSVTSSGAFNGRGARQLVRFSSRESRLAPRILHINTKATSQAWMTALTFMPHLEELVIENTHPSSPGVKVLQSLIARPVHTNNLSVVSGTGEWVAPLCPLLTRFGLKYRRWLRTSEHFDLIPDMLSVISSRTHSNCSLQSFRVWTRSDQEDALELVEDSQIAPEGFYRLANESGIKQEDSLDLVFMKLMDSSFPGEFFHPCS